MKTALVPVAIKNDMSETVYFDPDYYSPFEFIPRPKLTQVKRNQHKFDRGQLRKIKDFVLGR